MATTSGSTTTDVERRIERLSTVSLKKVIEPDVDVPGEIGPGRVLPDELLSVAGLDLDLTPEQRAVLSRAEEARHLAFARMILPGQWKDAGSVERFLVRRFAPLMVGGMFDMLVHPGVYEVVGLPGWKTWRAANRTPARLAIKHQALRSVLRAMIDAGVLQRGWI